MPKQLLFFLLLTLLTFLPHLQAAEYQSKEDFINEIFAGNPPKTQTLWINKQLKPAAAEILQHSPGFMRTRYWKDAQKSVWILNEVGKTKPITVAIVIENNKITLLKVLAFRESRGWEVKHSFFTDQFKQAALNEDLSLDKGIDGISGATLSVRALVKLAKLALFFEQQLQ
jgi:FMN-binding protein